MIWRLYRTRMQRGPLGKLVAEIDLPIPWVARVSGQPDLAVTNSSPQDVAEIERGVENELGKWLRRTGIKHPGEDVFGHSFPRLVAAYLPPDEADGLALCQFEVFLRRMDSSRSRSYRLLPPLDPVYDLRQLPKGADVGQDHDPWILAIPGVLEEYGVVFQGPNWIVPVTPRELSIYPPILVAIDQYLESR